MTSSFLQVLLAAILGGGCGRVRSGTLHTILSCKGVKAYATRSKGSMGKGFRLLD